METKNFNPKTVNPTTVPKKKIQPKLEVNPPNDIYEKQADKVADKVSRMPANSNDNLQMQPKEDEDKNLQMKSNEEEPKLQMQPEEDEKGIRMKPEEDSINRQTEEEEKGKIQRSSNGNGGQNVPQVSTELASQLNSSKGQGSPLPNNVSNEMGQKIGGDFSNVRVHTDDSSVQMNKELGAKAFTHGNDIYFNSGKYNTDNTSGKHLLAHELTHTMQQGKKINRSIQRAPIDDPGAGKSSMGKFDPLTGIYTVASGDNLTSIASRFNTTISEIQKNNPEIKDPDKILIGQKLFFPDLIMPHDPTGMGTSEMKYEDYVKKWEAEKGRPITAWEETQLKKGCVGVSAINTGIKPLDNLDNCYDSFEKALTIAKEKNKTLKLAGEDKTKKAVIFSMRFWSAGKPYKPDAAGKVDMSDYKGRLTTGDAWRPDDADGTDYINFDFGYYDVESGMWWHANHKHDPGGMGPMKVFKSTLEYYSKPLLDFDKQVFCVVVKNL